MNSSTTNSPTLLETLTGHASNLYDRAKKVFQQQRASMKTNSTVAKPQDNSVALNKPVVRSISSSVSTSPTLMTPRARTVYGGKRRKSKKDQRKKKGRVTKKNKKSNMHKRKGNKSRAKKSRGKH